MSNPSIYYEHHRCVTDNAQTLVICPGSAEGISRFEPYLETLTQHFNVVVFDNPGVGKSELFDFDVESLAQEYISILKSLNLKSFSVIGHSFGGFVAQEIALQAPEFVKDVVIIGIGCGSMNQQNILKYQFNFAARNCYYPSMFGKTFQTENAEYVAKYQAEKEEMFHPKVAFKFALESSRFSNLTIASYITSRTLIVQGAEDQIVIAENGIQLNQLIPDSELLLVKGAGHYPYIEDSSVWFKIIDFLNGKDHIGKTTTERLNLTDKMISQDRHFKKQVEDSEYPAKLAGWFKLAAEGKPEEAWVQYMEEIHGGRN
jgi:aminoacrylate hydrolase